MLQIGDLKIKVIATFKIFNLRRDLDKFGVIKGSNETIAIKFNFCDLSKGSNKKRK